MPKRGTSRRCVCLTVCLSVTLVYCIERPKISSDFFSAVILVFEPIELALFGQYLGNVTRLAQGYHGTLIEVISTRSIDVSYDDLV